MLRRTLLSTGAPDVPNPTKRFLLLDTQVVVVAAIQGLGSLPSKVQALLDDTSNVLFFSAISVMEIALKNNMDKLNLGQPALEQAKRDMRLTSLGFEDHHAYRLFSLPPHHRDPFDRMLIATALGDDIPLIGPDREFKRYKGLKVLW